MIDGSLLSEWRREVKYPHGWMSIEHKYVHRRQIATIGDIYYPQCVIYFHTYKYIPAYKSVAQAIYRPCKTVGVLAARVGGGEVIRFKTKFEPEINENELQGVGILNNDPRYRT